MQNNEIIIKIPLKKEFEKRIKVGFESVFENQTFYDQIEVILKEEESKLEFTVESFRNKIQPGSSENWSFQLKTFNTSKEAEVLASMYDSSLDQFAKRDWNGLKFNDYNYNSANFKTGLGFDKTSSYIRNLNPIFNRIELIDETTKLMWFGFKFNQTIKSELDAVLTVEPVGNGNASILEEADNQIYNTAGIDIKIRRKSQWNNN